MLLLVPHLFPPARLLHAAAQSLRLPALQTLLARGTPASCSAAGMEAAWCAALGIARQQDWPLAPITLEADGGTAGHAYWLRADPVHLQVMRDRIVLADNSALDLSQQEADALTNTIARHFGEALQPLPLHPRRWYVQYSSPPRLVTTPVSAAIGRDIDPLLPQGSDAMQVRAQLNELQMLLHEHPVNLAREARGELPVNSVWLWGGGVRPASPAAAPPVFARNDMASALAAFCNTVPYPLPARLDPSMLRTAGVILLEDLMAPGQCGDAHGWHEAICGLETNWFAPLLGALRTPGGQGMRLADPLNGRSLRLQASDVWKIWRRPRDLISMLTY